MANAAVDVDERLLLIAARRVRRVLMLMVPEMLNRRGGGSLGFVLTIRRRARPGELERQDQRKKDQKKPTHQNNNALAGKA